MSSRGPFPRRWIRFLLLKLMSVFQTWMTLSVKRWVLLPVKPCYWSCIHKSFYYGSNLNQDGLFSWLKQSHEINKLIILFVIIQTQVCCMGWQDDSRATNTLMSNYPHVSCCRDEISPVCNLEKRVLSSGLVANMWSLFWFSIQCNTLTIICRFLMQSKTKTNYSLKYYHRKWTL